MKNDYFSETAGALAPDLEGAAHSRAHPVRIKRADHTAMNRGDKPLASKANLPAPPKRP